MAAVSAWEPRVATLSTARCCFGSEFGPHTIALDSCRCSACCWLSVASKGCTRDVGRWPDAVSGKRADSSQAQNKAHSTRWRHGALGRRRRTRRLPLQWGRRCFRQLRWRGSGRCRVKWRRGWWVGSMKSREQQESSPRRGVTCNEALSNHGVHPTPCAPFSGVGSSLQHLRARRG